MNPNLETIFEEKDISSHNQDVRKLDNDGKKSDVVVSNEKEITDVDDPTLYEKSAKAIKTAYTKRKQLAINPLVATITTISSRREECLEYAKQRQKYIETEQEKCEKKFEEVFAKFKNQDIKVAVHLKKRVDQFKIECENHLKEKDKIIEKLKNDIIKNNEEVVKVGCQQEDEVHILAERLRKFITNLHEISQHELNSIQFTLNNIKEKLLTETCIVRDKLAANEDADHETWENIFHNDIWEKTYALREHHLLTYNIFHESRTKLSTECHNMILQLSELRSTQYLNLDKLKVGLYVIQHQLKENKIISCEMKRFNVQNFDKTLALKSALKSVEEVGEKSHIRQLNQYLKTKTNLGILIIATKQHHDAQKQRYHDVAKAHGLEILKLLYEALRMDSFIFEHLLHIKWEAPDLSFTQIEKSIQKEEDIVTKWVKYLKKELITTKSDVFPKHRETLQRAPSFFNVTRPLDIKKLLLFICGELEFLIQESVTKLCKVNYAEIEEFILTNSMFNEIGINSREDLFYFMAHILKHAHRNDNEQTVILVSNDILTGFYDYVSSQKENIESEGVSFDEKCFSDERKEACYWQPYTTIISADKEMLWDSVIQALKKYVMALDTFSLLYQKRTNILQENVELQILLNTPNLEI